MNSFNKLIATGKTVEVEGQTLPLVKFDPDTVMGNGKPYTILHLAQQIWKNPREELISALRLGGIDPDAIPRDVEMPEGMGDETALNWLKALRLWGKELRS